MYNLSQEDEDRIQNANEDTTEKEFRIRHYDVRRLDRGNSGRRPDFSCANGSDIFIVEVKTCFSVGGGKRGILDASDNPYSFFPDPKLQDLLSNAHNQYECLIRDCKQYNNVPFVVAIYDETKILLIAQLLHDDFFRPHSPKERMQEGAFHLNLISAVIVPIKNRRRAQIINELGVEALSIIENDQSGIYKPDTFEWGVIFNKEAINPIDLELFMPALKL